MARSAGLVLGGNGVPGPVGFRIPDVIGVIAGAPETVAHI